MRKNRNVKAVFDHRRRDSIRYAEMNPAPIGEVPEHRIPIIDRNGILKGHMGKLAAEPTARRVGNLGGHAVLQQHGGRKCWVEQ